MGGKEFSKKLSAVLDEAVKNGVMQGHMTFSQVIGTLEMAKMDIHNFALGVAQQRQQQAAEESASKILVPDGFTPESEIRTPH